MRIERIRIIRVAMPLIYPFRTAFGNDDVIESVLVQLSSGDLSGWGESACWRSPAYCAECSASQFLVSRDFVAPQLLNQQISSGRELQSQLSSIKDNHFAKAAFDLAWWDLYAKARNQPLWKLLGGISSTVSAGADFGIMGCVAELIESVGQAIEQGYPRIKLKFRPGWDLNMIEQVRWQFPDTVIHIDCNSHYSLRDVEMFKQLDSYKLAMIEQPLAHNDLIDHAVLQKQIETPICLDESIVSADRARKAIQVGACRWVNIKLGRVGGITNALEVKKVCEEGGTPCWVGGMLESAIGSSHNIAFATLSNIGYPSDIFPTSRFYTKDLSTASIEHSAPGQFKATDESGIGACPDEDRLQELAIEQIVLS